MTIIRAPKPPEKYYKLNHSIARDKRLGWAARGVLIYLLTRPDNWETSVTNLCNEVAESSNKTGRDATYKIINQLIDAGYISRLQPRNEDGSLGKQVLLIGEDANTLASEIKRRENKPVPEKPEAADSPLPDLPYPAQPYPVKPTQRTNDLKEQTKDKKNNDISLVDSDAENKKPKRILAGCFAPDECFCADCDPDVQFLRKITADKWKKQGVKLQDPRPVKVALEGNRHPRQKIAMVIDQDIADGVITIKEKIWLAHAIKNAIASLDVETSKNGAPA